jgi:cysteine-rich repeat protein
LVDATVTKGCEPIAAWVQVEHTPRCAARLVLSPADPRALPLVLKFDVEPGLAYLPECGNGSTEWGEECDDGNPTAGDGYGPQCVVAACGNGYLEPGELGDDGNLLDVLGRNRESVVARGTHEDHGVAISGRDRMNMARDVVVLTAAQRGVLERLVRAKLAPQQLVEGAILALITLPTVAC